MFETRVQLQFLGFSFNSTLNGLTSFSFYIILNIGVTFQNVRHKNRLKRITTRTLPINHLLWEWIIVMNFTKEKKPEVNQVSACATIY